MDNFYFCFFFKADGDWGTEKSVDFTVNSKLGDTIEQT